MASPLLNEKTFEGREIASSGGAMTVQGTTNKSIILFGLMLATGMFAFNTPAAAPLWAGVGLLGAFAICIALYFKPAWSPVLAPAYALLEGLFLGAISAIFAKTYDGIVTQAMMITLGVFAAMLALYSFGLVRPTEKFRAIVLAATAGIALVYLASMIMGFFGIKIPMIHQGGMIGIGFSLFVVTIAALNLIIDFGNIEDGAAANAPKYMEWYCAFGLLVTLVWLYLEVLRLLLKLRSND